MELPRFPPRGVVLVFLIIRRAVVFGCRLHSFLLGKNQAEPGWVMGWFDKFTLLQLTGRGAAGLRHRTRVLQGCRMIPGGLTAQNLGCYVNVSIRMEKECKQSVCALSSLRLTPRLRPRSRFICWSAHKARPEESYFCKAASALHVTACGAAPCPFPLLTREDNVAPLSPVHRALLLLKF